MNLGNLPGMVPKTPRWLDPVYFGHADVQSITLSACKGFVLLTWLDSQDRSNVQVSSLNPSDDSTCKPHLHPPSAPKVASPRPSYSCSPKVQKRTVHDGNAYSNYTRAKCLQPPGDATYNLISQRSFENTTIRCACAAPPNSPYTFAIGSDDCPILVLDQEMNQVSSPSGPSSPTLALTFLTESPHVLLAGKRSGQIPLLDLRVDGGGRGGLRHASSVARVVQAGENTVVVAGLQDRMCVYDLRFLKEKWKKDATRPVARMWGHRNEARHDVDLAVDRGTGLVAAAQVEGGGGVRVFDGQSGVEVGYVAGGQVEGEYVRQVRFVEGKHGVGLWVSRGAEIVEYSCRPDGRYV